MPKSREKEKLAVPPSVRTVAGALIALRDVMKKEHGIDVDVEVRVYSWPTTHRLAQLAIEDMVSEIDGWRTEHRTSSGRSLSGGEDLHFYDAQGQGLNKGLTVTIFKIDGEKSQRMVAIPKSFKKYGKAAYAVTRIRLLFRELYGVDASVKVNAKVKVSDYLFSPSFNKDLTLDGAVEILNTIKNGTDWSMSDSETRYSPSFGYHRFILSGKNIDFEISFDLPKDE